MTRLLSSLLSPSFLLLGLPPSWLGIGTILNVPTVEEDETGAPICRGISGPVMVIDVTDELLSYCRLQGLTTRAVGSFCAETGGLRLGNGVSADQIAFHGGALMFYDGANLKVKLRLLVAEP